ncbi:accessory gene regulator B family protein [Cohnella mopanensis]|uniref:accessory gene regulator B family protein n=1 Tax=Cohnella mopanensis TaxID=2911966 RepID=UPI001EF985EC|nr:accessory gene regulator B family protein [Cohnella mopanensis]
MIDSIALKMAEAIKKAEPTKTASIEVMKFSLVVILHTALTVVFIVIIGIITNSLELTMIGLMSFIVLRFFSGGLHLKKAINCSIVSTILISVAPHIPLAPELTIIIIGISLLIALFLAPANIINHARIPKKYFPLLKLISVLLISSNFIFMSSTIAVAHLLQAITLIPYMRRW